MIIFIIYVSPKFTKNSTPNVTLTRASLTAETAGNIEDRVKVWKKPMAAGLALLSRSPAGQTSAIWGDESENSLRISLLASF